MIRLKGRPIELNICRNLIKALPILFILNSVAPLWAFSNLQRVHSEITSVALYHGAANPQKATLSDGSSLTFSSKAFISDILPANILTDLNQFDSKIHFDDDALDLGSVYLFGQKKTIAKKLASANLNGQKAVEARRLLGTSLHTVQDYYSHSTWVETHNPPNVFDTRLGRSRLPVPSGSTATCEADLETFITASNALTSGYYSNFLTCPDVEKPGQKCAHGTGFPLIGCDGINKDNSGRPGYLSARNLAIEATKDYVRQVLQEISGNDEAIKLLMVGEEDVFKIDQGSFSASINRDLPFPSNPIDKTYVVEHNLERSTVAFNVSSTANWVTVTPSGGGTLVEGEEDGREILVTINGNAIQLPAGNHTATLKFTGVDTTQERAVILEVTEDPGGPIIVVQ